MLSRRERGEKEEEEKHIYETITIICVVIFQFKMFFFFFGIVAKISTISSYAIYYTVHIHIVLQMDGIQFH